MEPRDLGLQTGQGEKVTDDRPARPRWAALRTLGLIAAGVGVGLAAGIVLMRGGPNEAANAAGRAGGASQARGGQFAARPPAVTLVRPDTTTIDQSVTAIGTGRAIQSLTLTAEVSGIITEILIEPGQSVEEGARLVILDKREQEISVARARADYAIAKTNAARFEGLVADEAASALEDEAARNELSAATAQLRQAEYELSRRTIRAPFAGVVGLTKLNIGDFLQSGATVTTVDDVSSLLVDFVVPEGASAYVKEDLEVTAIALASGGLVVTGRIRAVDSRVDPASRTRRIEAIFANEERALIPGSTFSISLVAPGRQAIVVPGLALQWDRAGSYVWKAGADGAAERVPVVVLQRTAQAVLVEAALSSSDLIVSEGAAMVRAGAPLKTHGADGRSSDKETSSAY